MWPASGDMDMDADNSSIYLEYLKVTSWAVAEAGPRLALFTKTLSYLTISSQHLFLSLITHPGRASGHCWIMGEPVHTALRLISSGHPGTLGAIFTSVMETRQPRKTSDFSGKQMPSPAQPVPLKSPDYLGISPSRFYRGL